MRGARERNLRDVDVDIPLGRWTAVIGPSGSGKTALVYGVFVREGQRRFLGHLSARARQYLRKLGRADADHVGPIPAAISVGSTASQANVRSTVGTMTGVLDGLRLLFARAAVSPSDTPLTSSHFSFNRVQGQCDACSGLGVQDAVDPALIVRDPSKSLRDGALIPTLKNGYTVYSQVTAEVMDRICRAHGFTLDTPWNVLTDDQRHVVLYGTTALTVPFGKHDIASRMKWSGITAKPREEGFYKGLVPVIEETLKRSRNPSILRFVRSVPCEVCDGTRLGPVGRSATVNGHTLPALLHTPVSALDLAVLGDHPVVESLKPSISARLSVLRELGLGHLTLDRPSTTLSGGETQRVRLVALLTAELSGVLYAIDEPTLGLHPSSQPGLVRVFKALRDAGNTVVTVEHDPDMVRHADHLVVMGPGAGRHGGEVLYSGVLPDNPLGTVPDPRVPRPGDDALTLTGATLHGLQHVTLTVPLAALTVVRGPSGAGKSSLVLQTLVPALTGQSGGPYTGLSGVPDSLAVHAIDASPIGRTPRSTPATWTGLFDRVRKRFAKASGRPAGAFSYNNVGARCPRCEGLGVERITLHLLDDAVTTCPDCLGGRYSPAALDICVWGRTIAEVLALPIGDAIDVFADEADLLRTVSALDALGLGHLTLGQSSTTLSRGEAQRVKLGTLLATPRRHARLLVMDEPDRGLHPSDIDRLLTTLNALVDQGDTVLAISHHRGMWAAADHIVSLHTGRITTHDDRSATPLSMVSAPSPEPARPDIVLQGVRTHGLPGLDATFRRGHLTAVTGPSGSGKSSLVQHTLAAEAWHRFAESLPATARRQIERLPRAVVDTASGLTPTLSLSQRDAPPRGPRSTVATLSGVGPLLRLLWSRVGTLDGRPCEHSASFFSPDVAEGACPACSGVGTIARCDPARLVLHPDKPLFDGALDGTRPGRHVGAADGRWAAHLHAAVPGVEWTAPWSALSNTAQDAALHGTDGTIEVVWQYTRGKRTGEHRFTEVWPGLCALVEQEATARRNARAAKEWAAPLVDRPCSECDGARLNAVAREVTVDGRTLPSVLARPLDTVSNTLVGPDTLLTDVRTLLAGLCNLSLSHLSLDRRADSLSTGELQRVRLAGVLRAGLTHATVVLDEPDAGLHARDVANLAHALRPLRDAGNTLIVVTHRGVTQSLADDVFVLGDAPDIAPAPRQTVSLGAVRIRGARAYNLDNIDIDLPESGLVAVTGVSGSGKSSLVFDVLGASAAAGEPVNCSVIAGLDRFSQVISARRPPRDPLAALGLLPALQSLFSAQSDALPRAAFSYHSPTGRCPTCRGTGTESVALDGLGDLSLPCPTCHGARYAPHVLAVRWMGLNIAEVLSTSVAALPGTLPSALATPIRAMVHAGLGHLSLGRRPGSLSGGEAQRLMLVAAMLSSDSQSLVLLDEPGAGLHDSDIARLTHSLRALTDRGCLIVATAHRLAFIRAADHVIDLGPGGGPHGGRIVATGTADTLRHGATADALRS